MMQGELQDFEVKTQAVIYIGPSSIGVIVTELANQEVRLLDFLQQPVPIARDVFRFHLISRSTIDRCVQVLGDFKEILKEYATGSSFSVKLIMSNIIAEASNVDVFMNRIHVAHNIRGRLMDDGKMTRLIYVKVQETLAQYTGLNKKKILVVHLGPGNTRMLLFQRGRISKYSCYRLGTHRTGEAVGEIEFGEDATELSLLREHMRGQIEQIRVDYGNIKNLDGLVIIGQEMQQLKTYFNTTANECVSIDSLSKEAEKMSHMTLEERMLHYDVNFSEVDSLLPGILMSHAVAQVFNMKELMIPSAGYTEGFMLSAIRADYHTNDLEAEVLHFAGILADRYKADKGHREHVRNMAVSLFDQLEELHRLNRHDRLLLETAAILHEIGVYISQPNHELHSQYLVLNSEVFGLSREDVELVALLVRYHRHANPSDSDPIYGDLALVDRMRVSKMAAILRVADALERGHAQRVRGVVATIRGKVLELELVGVRETAVEDLALKLKGDLFTDIFGYDVVLSHE